MFSIGRSIIKSLTGGEILLINREMFREFHTDKEAYDWGMNYFGLWIRDIQPDKDNKDKNNIANLLYAYTGNMYILYNEFLRGYNVFDESSIEEPSKNIAIITEEISKFELQESIIVYRYTHKECVKYMFQSLKTKIGQTFTDKAFMSTTLLPSLLKDFAKQHKYNCILKLYLPKGTKGAYIRFDNSLLNEHEFLLPPNATFRLIKRYFSFKYHMVYECELINQ